MSETKLDERLDKYESEPTKDTWAVRQDHFSRRYFVETVDDIGTVVVADVQNEQRARFIAAAGTAAQEAREIGYDPQKAVEALPIGLEQVRCAIIDLLDGPPGDTSEPAIRSAISRLAGFLSDASDTDVSEIVDDKMLDEALASAEGRDDE